MHKFKAVLIGLLCLGIVTGCSTNTNPGNVVYTTKATIQLAVGTINDTAGILSANSGGGGAPGVYLDAIGTFRNQLGNSAFGTGGVTGTSSGQSALAPVVGEGPCNFTTGAGCNVGAPALYGAGAALYAYGQFPGYNGVNAAAPAWAAPGTASGFLWDFDAFDLFPKGPDGTNYTLTDTVVINGQPQTYSASATLDNPSRLLAAGTAVYAANGATGGGTFTFGAPPANVTEQVAVVLSSTIGNGVLAMAEAVAPGTSAVLPANTLVTGHVYTCFVIDADFPWVEAGVVNAPAVGTPTPVIVGNNGNADLSVSNTFPCTG
ncbi:MAG TPA: hypothetical protein VKF82_03100 [Candidatus Eremiobacteraceae bacterium]|nr:hypothetical protein [Candidatus Eremiobacteraceae bacterium]